MRYRFALIPIRCSYCGEWIWLKKYRIGYATRLVAFCTPVFDRWKVCKSCNEKYFIH